MAPLTLFTSIVPYTSRQITTLYDILRLLTLIKDPGTLEERAARSPLTRLQRDALLSKPQDWRLLMSILAHTQSGIASLDADIAVLGENLAALQDLACSFPVGVTLSDGKRAAFDALFDTVTAQFEHVAGRMVASGIPVEAVLC